ncbi:MAG: hypothetical protein JXB05_36210 [Myxococcaceae bacterium]|nr:hypothetical protein [Myxococcaceae bacterium]
MALVVGGGASAALASDPPRASGKPLVTATPRATNNTQAVEPTSFDLAASLGSGREVVVYRYQRVEKKLVLLERFNEDIGKEKTQSFNKVATLKNSGVALSPEGKNKPPPPPPTGGGLGAWKVPQAELDDAVKQLRAREPKAGEISIGRLEATAPAK